MNSMIILIKAMDNKIKKLEEVEKKIEKTLVALTQEHNDSIKNIAMFKRTLEESLTSIQNNEIEMKDEKQKKIGNKADWSCKPVCIINEHGEKIVVYESRSQAAINLNISLPTITRRLKMEEENQIKKYGYALKNLKK